MRNRFSIFLIPVLALAGAIWQFPLTTALAGTIQPQAQSRTVLDGVFSEAQAERGYDEYLNHCSSCHDEACSDGPHLIGPAFIERWRDDSLGALVTFVRSNMPSDTPGKLEENTYLDIIAYLLAVNDYPAGTGDLTAALAADTALVGKDGPQPLPNNTLIQTVGCLSQDSNNAWILTNAANPVRTRKGDEATAQELKESAVKPLGTQTFRLPNITEFRSGFNPASLKGGKVQAKGVLVWQPNNDRISLTALDTVASTCVK